MRNTVGWLLSLLLVCQLQLAGASAMTISDELTPEEKRSALALAESFTKQWEENGDMKRIVESLYAPDFIERFIAEEKKEIGTLEEQTKGRIFMPGIEYLPSLLETAPKKEWRQLYITLSELLFYFGSHTLNQMAGATLQGKEPESEQIGKSIERVIPEKMRQELARHPILKNFVVKQSSAVPISTPAEMKEVIALLEKTKMQVRQTQGSTVYQPTQAARKVMDMLMPEFQKLISAENVNESKFLLPPNTRMIVVPTRLLHFLVVAQFNGQYKILWTAPITI